ncbi:MAG: hypothetical protein ACRCVV_21865 [Shewanella sp.]
MILANVNGNLDLVSLVPEETTQEVSVVADTDGRKYKVTKEDTHQRLFNSAEAAITWIRRNENSSHRK